LTAVTASTASWASAVWRPLFGARSTTTPAERSRSSCAPPADRPEEQRFERGARISSQLNHPHITTVHDFGHTGTGFTYLVMELLEGQSLAHLLKRGRPDLRTALHIADQVLRALEHAHAAGVVHRDLKPSNLFLTAKNDDPNFVKILDFGIAKHVAAAEVGEDGDGITREHQVCGTPEYISPEQIRANPVDARADLYSFGVVMYRMLTGQLPFKSRDWTEAWFAHLNEAVPPFPVESGVPAAIEQVVRRALEKRPDDRFADALEMRTALRAAAKSAAPELGISLTGMYTNSSSMTPFHAPSTGEVPPVVPRRRTVVAVAVVVLIGAAVGAWVGLDAAPTPPAPVAATAAPPMAVAPTPAPAVSAVPAPPRPQPAPPTPPKPAPKPEPKATKPAPKPAPKPVPKPTPTPAPPPVVAATPPPAVNPPPPDPAVRLLEAPTTRRLDAEPGGAVKRLGD
jgi:hypothetical protein